METPEQYSATRTTLAEKSIHDKMRSLAQQLWDEHGIAVQSVRFDWIDCSTPLQTRMMLKGVDVESASKP